MSNKSMYNRSVEVCIRRQGSSGVVIVSQDAIAMVDQVVESSQFVS